MGEKIAFVTGAAGFAGCNLTEHLLGHGYRVYAIVRPGSEHNKRIKKLRNVVTIELDLSEISRLDTDRAIVQEKASGGFFFHLAWQGGRYDFAAQKENIDRTICALEAACRLSCRRFIATGSQAEYGATDKIITEELLPEPFCDYGAAKAAVCFLSRRRANALGMEWIWARIFSLYGKYEPHGRLLPDLYKTLVEGKGMQLSSCLQEWDFLDAADAAEALIALAEKGRPGEIYNVANGDYRPLKEYVEIMIKRYSNLQGEMVSYGAPCKPYVCLKPCIEKIFRDTGWKAEVSFEDGIEIFGK